MRKHHSGKGPKRQWHNANRRVPDACTNLVKSLCDGIPGGTVATDYLRSEYLSKFNGKGTVSPAERRDAAIRKWREIEQLNAGTNARLRGLNRGYNVLPRISLYRFLEVCQRIIRNILGPLHDELVLGSFTGGASTSRRRTDSHPAEKFCGRADVTTGAQPYIDLIHRLSAVYREYQFGYSLREVVGAELFTVPKKTEIDRCACKEPDINMFLQKGVGRHIRRRLRRVGIDLNDQSTNRRLAKRGSIEGDLATIDLSSASDTVTRSCVLALLPLDWYLYMEDIRSQCVKVEGQFRKVNMFSSMGNGFTFELESLLFYALARATAYLRGHVGIISVYGDDIIVPSGMYDDFTWVLEVFGFRVNPDKSFSTGSFRESCGGHYDNGIDITPFYLRREPTHLTDVIRVCNQLRLWATTELRQYEIPGLYELWLGMANFVPRDLWGGFDPVLDTQLVSVGPSKNRLSRIADDRPVPEVGRYLHWQTNTRNRGRDVDVESPFPPVEDTRKCRRRPSKPGAVAFELLFREEW